jgi:hypothetical protein
MMKRYNQERMWNWIQLEAEMQEWYSIVCIICLQHSRNMFTREDSRGMLIRLWTLTNSS